MSTLTKVLVVLLSLFSLFMCGVVVTYVGNANNYKVMYEEQKNLNSAIEQDNAMLSRQFNEKTAEMKELEKELRNEIQRLSDEKGRLEMELRNTERANLEYTNRINSWAGVLTSFEQTIENMEKSREQILSELGQTRTDLIKDRKELNEITASLYQKIVEMEALEADRRRFLEEKTQLEKQLSQLSGPRTKPDIQPVTADYSDIEPAPGAETAESAIKGLITEIGQSLVTLSVGSADGVEEGMVFHVTRGNDFICDIVVTDVDTNRAAGVKELVQQQPKVGDNVSTVF